MATPGHKSAASDTGASDTLSPPPRTTLSRPASRRTLRSLPSSDGSTNNPLFSLASSSSGTAEPAAQQYAVYSGKKRAALPTSTASSSSPLSPAEGPLTGAPTTSSASATPPFSPSTPSNLPPLVSRPSNSTLPTSSGRSYARSVSEAKEQLQKQALKAELQSLGLSAESVGAAVVNRLANLGEEAEFKGTTLLLPAEKLDPSLALNAPFFLDHLVLLDPPAPSTSSAPRPQGFVTLSGLRGHMSTDELVFTSCWNGKSEEGKLDYASVEVQSALRGAAAPAPPNSSLYPSTMLISAVTPMSIPQARASSSFSTTGRDRATTTSRLAALFAKPSASPATSADSSDLPPMVPAPAGLLGGGDATSLMSENGGASSRKSGTNLDVPVLAVGKGIRRAEIVAGIAAGVEAQLREASGTVQGVAGEAPVVDHLVAFAARVQPPSSKPSSSTASTAAEPPATPESLFAADPENVSEAFQDALHSVRLDLTRNLGSAPSSDPAAPSLEDFSQLEDRVDTALEELESVVTSVLYDRLYAPPVSRDLQEDENLCSRVAALNVLELDLEHLGLDLGDETGLPGWERESRTPKETLEALAERIGKELDRLEHPHERTPSAKLAILVECHALLVDGLSKLPPVPLKKEFGEDRTPPSDRPVEVEMDDASSRNSSQPPSRPRSPGLSGLSASATEDELLKTPRPHIALNEDVPEIKLPDSTADTPELSSSVFEATSSSLFEPSIPAPSPPHSVFESSRRATSVSSSSTSSADLILPLLIYSVVRANPPHLVSHLNFIHRFRSDSLLRGQSSYCYTNFSACHEFLTTIDVSSLGISSQKILAASPAPSPALSSSPSSVFSFASGRPRAHTTGHLIRGRVSHEIDNLVGNANTALAGLFSGAREGAAVLGGVAPRSLDDVRSVLEGARGRARESLPFRRSASTRTLNGGATVEGKAATGQREMVDIAPSAPGGTPDGPADAYAALPSATSAPPPLPPRTSSAAADTDAASIRSASPTKQRKDDSDTRSIRSISSLLKDTTLARALGDGNSTSTSAGGDERPSFGERLAGLPLGLGRFGGTASASPAGSRRSTLLNPILGSPTLSATSVAGVQPRFLEVASAAELRVGEVQELLEGYRRLAARVAELEALQAKEGGEAQAA
ncbi:hypothetical protein JCM10207_004262 [Rhodosporidiobolus poonsookiae]